MAVSVFPGEQYQAPRSWAERAYPNLIYYNEVDKGGHFAAWEQPELFADELRAAFRSLRQEEAECGGLSPNIDLPPRIRVRAQGGTRTVTSECTMNDQATRETTAMGSGRRRSVRSTSRSGRDLDDLRRRIARRGCPREPSGNDRSQGVQLATTQELARYWATDYDWRKCEARLNALPQFTTEIDGVDIHFIHVRSKHAMRCR